MNADINGALNIYKKYMLKSNSKNSKVSYLMSRGLSEDDARAMIVRGFAYPVSKELPVEYAVDMNNLINLELEGGIG